MTFRACILTAEIKTLWRQTFDYYVKVLLANGIRPEFHIYPGGHTRSYWSDHAQEYMDFYMSAWPEPVTQP